MKNSIAMILIVISFNFSTCLADTALNFSDSMKQGYEIGQGTFIVKVELDHDTLVFSGDVTGKLQLPAKFEKHYSFTSNKKFVMFHGSTYVVTQPNSAQKMYDLTLSCSSNALANSPSNVRTLANKSSNNILMKTSNLVEAWQFAGQVFIETFRLGLAFQLCEILEIKDSAARLQLEEFINEEIVYKAGEKCCCFRIVPVKS